MTAPFRDRVGVAHRSPSATRILILAVTLAVVLTGFAALRHDRRPHVPARTAAELATLGLVPAPGRTGTSTCTDPVREREWRVTWRAVATGQPLDSSAPLLADALADRAESVDLVPTGFAVRPLERPSPASSPSPRERWRSADTERWELRWTPTPSEVLTARNVETWVRVGPLATLAATPLTVAQDPKYLSPDGECTLYLRPFVAGTAGRDNTAAVVGDSLVAQLTRPQTVLGLTDGDSAGAGFLLRRLAARYRVEIDGQPGRRWTAKPDPPSALEGADATLRDELRGLRGARTTVVALGTNDAGWVALATDRAQFDQRMAWVLARLGATLDELAANGRCTVLVTLASRGRSYAGSAPGRFARAADRVNALLRERADGHRLRLADWGRTADPHGRDDVDPWFGHDTIHLNRAGFTAYADALARAATLC